MNKLRAICVVLLLSGGPNKAGEGESVTERSNARFTAVDVVIDSGEQPLAAYQLSFSGVRGEVKIVGVEGGEHPAFKQPPYYDPKAIQHERVVLAAFNTARADQLPKGKTRVVTIHLQVSGVAEPEYLVKAEAAATTEGQRISIQTSVRERSAK